MARELEPQLRAVPGDNLVLTFVTLGVQDVQRALAFYEKGLGWQTRSSQGFHYFLLGAVKVALYPAQDLARDAGLDSVATPGGPAPCNFALAVNVQGQDQVDLLLDRVLMSGGRVTKPGEYKFWGGYVGFFTDPEGNLWEVVWNPHLAID